MTNPYDPSQNNAAAETPATAEQAQYGQGQYGQGQYAQPMYQSSAQQGGINGDSTKSWVINLILESFLSVIWWIVILVSSDQSESRKNYAKARLIVFGIFIALFFIIMIIAAIIGASMLPNPSQGI
ncbi:hypothetical protein [Boudabousia marimammalium]|uniref:DUF4190 domain-containing protein n=1 Tax=Boudabousia marimammalium TaxID=156892 RepID=A0A1Q5PKF5_9ACTO|nr:hypothetical protein [Boudabousia marimammalium]OKL46703.1 hypothetical protein BM477_07050 [Boudabousia marimammalium]